MGFVVDFYVFYIWMLFVVGVMFFWLSVGFWFVIDICLIGLGAICYCINF